MKKGMKILITILIFSILITLSLIHQYTTTGPKDNDNDGIPDHLDFDDDNDGMPDWWEERYYLDPLDASDRRDDNENDALVNIHEYSEGTLPNDSDTDDDGLPDGWEVIHSIRDPVTGLHVPNPLDGSDHNHDPDNDGLTNAQEFFYGTHPNLADTDGDGITDGDEVMVYDLDPCSSNGDWDIDHDGLSNLDELAIGTDPYNTDSDHDGLSDLDEHRHTKTSPLSCDTDSDSMPDGWEVMIGLDPLSGTDAALDLDDDRVINSEEYQVGTSPWLNDTDSDGLTDGDELERYRTNPADSANPNRRFAILVAPAGYGEDAYKREITMTRDYLLQLGYNDNTIVFLTTKDRNALEPSTEPWIDGDANFTNLGHVFSALRHGGEVLGTDFGNGTDTNDLLFFELRDHGGGYLDHRELGYDPGLVYGRVDGGHLDPLGKDENDTSEVMYDECFCTYEADSIRFNVSNFWYDDEFADALDQLEYHQLVLLLDFCFSGGFIHDCQGPQRVIVSSTSENDLSGNRVYMFGERHTDPIYEHYLADGGQIGAFPSGEPVLGTADGVISIEESHSYTVLQIPSVVQEPMIYDGIEGETYL